MVETIPAAPFGSLLTSAVLPTRLTNDGFVPVMTPDGRRVVFISSQNGVQSPWTVPIAGGAPTQVVNAFVASVFSLDVSPDSNSTVFSSTDDSGRRIVVVCDLPTCGSQRTLTLPFGGVGRVKWTSNGRALAFIDAAESNVWIQPFDGRPPQQVTRFADRRVITDFAWSPDGTRLAVARASTTSDIVLFNGLRR